MVQVEEKRTKEDDSKDSLELSSRDSLGLSICDHRSIQDTPPFESALQSQDTQEVEDTQAIPTSTQQKRDREVMMALLDSSGSDQSTSLLALAEMDSEIPEVVEELRGDTPEDPFNVTTDEGGMLNPTDMAIKDLEKQLKAKIKSLTDALSTNQVLKTENLSLTRELEYANSKLEEATKKISDKEKELQKLDKALKKAAEKEELRKKGGDGQEISDLQKKIADLTEERDKARTNAAANSKLMEMMERNFDEASVKLDKFQKETLCRDKNCESTNLPRTAPISMTLQSS